MLIPSDHSWLPIEISSHGGFPLRHTDKHASNQHELNPSQFQDGCSRIATQITASYHDLHLEILGLAAGTNQPACS
jgi:hypothetical protein